MTGWTVNASDAILSGPLEENPIGSNRLGAIRSGDVPVANIQEAWGVRSAPGYRPLYRQVKEELVRRIAEQVWSPGAMIPSEQQIASELAVSQGTVRKALDEMTAERLLIRRQGRGTFVARHDEARILFQFFKLVPDGGFPSFPESEVRRVEPGVASAEEADKLRLAPGAPLIRIARRRDVVGRPAISEYIALPAVYFPGLEANNVPNNLYDMFATRFGITVAGGTERIKAVACSAEDAAVLAIAPGEPVLSIDRLALSIDGTPVEWRVSLCRTDAFSYVSELR